MGFTETQTTKFTAIGGSLVKGFGTIQQGRIAQIEADAQADVQMFNARVLERNAKARIEKAKFDQVRQALRGRKILGRQIARAAASGALLDEGAPLRAITEQAEELELENLLIGHEGMVDAMRTRQEAGLTRIGARNIRRRGKIAARTATTKAATGLLSDFATFEQQGFFEKTPKKKKSKAQSILKVSSSGRSMPLKR